VSRGASCSTPGNHVYTRVDAYAQLAAASFRAATKAAQMNVAAAANEHLLDEEREEVR
jgi:hypothetical protein